MKTLWNKHWFFATLAVLVVVGFFTPEAAGVIKQYRLVSIGIFASFMCTGLTLKTAHVLEQFKNVKALAAAMISVYVVATLLMIPAGKMLFADQPALVVGIVLAAAVPVTIASGLVITALAGGQVALSLLICIATNLAGIVITPFIITLSLDVAGDIHIPVAPMMKTLALSVLLPVTIGQIARRHDGVRRIVEARGKWISVFCQCVVLGIIFNAVSRSGGQIRTVPVAILLGVAAFTGTCHGALLGINAWIGRLIGLRRTERPAFMIQCSQKTIAIATVIWLGYMAEDYPMALIPVMFYHFLQLVIDTVVARRCRAAMEINASDAV